MRENLESLSQQYPLDQSWPKPEIYKETLRLEGLELELVGLSIEREDGTIVTASAADVEGSPLRRAYFELTERAALFAKRDANTFYNALDAMGGTCAVLREDQVFIPNPNPREWKFSLSNGVAAHTDFEAAAESAFLELVERDRILRSWYGGLRPKAITRQIAQSSLLDQLSAWYDIEVFEFDEQLPGESRLAIGVRVVGVFAFPKPNTGGASPFVYGFGAKRDLNLAFNHAIRECIQRVGFLWGEALSEELPEFSASPDYHQEVFLRAPGQRNIRRWLSGEHASASGCALRATRVDPQGERVVFADITPESVKGSVWVLKALSASRQPLWFGKGSRFLERNLSDEFLIHPVV
ncbi:MAG: YcaO-like family protein [Bdellovibrionota bacterium]